MNIRNSLPVILISVLCLTQIMLNAQRFGVPVTLDEREAIGRDVITYGDLDNDGDEDIVSASRYKMHVNEQLGPNSFAAPITSNIELDHYITGINTAHIDNDGLLDIVVYSYGKVYWVKNLGGLQFEESVPLLNFFELNVWNTNMTRIDFTITDTNEDGFADFIVSHLTYREGHVNPLTVADPGFYIEDVAAEIFLLENDGLGNFTTLLLNQFLISETQFDTDVSTRVAVGDINEDGHADIVTYCRIAKDIFFLTSLKNGPGTYTTSTENLGDISNIRGDILLNDRDNDGMVDVSLSESSKWFQQQSDGSFVLEEFDLQLSVGYSYYALEDWNGDGLDDIIGSSYSSGLVVHPNTGNLTYSEGVHLENRRALDVKSFPGEHPGLLVVDEYYFAQLFRNTPSGIEAIALDDRGVRKLESIATLDIDNDADLDIVCAKNFHQGLSFFESAGGFDYGLETEITNAPAFVKKVIARDLNNDQLDDIVFHTDVTVGFMLNNGDLTFAAPVQISYEVPIDAIEVGQVLENEMPELIVLTQGAVLVYENVFANGISEPFAEFDLAYSTKPTQIGVTDVDSDGDADVALARSNFTWLENTNEGLELNVEDFNCAPATTYYDYNLDGAIDIVVPKNNDLKIYTYDESTEAFDVIYEQALTQNGLYENASLLEDLNGDGLVDLLSSGLDRKPSWVRGLPNGQMAGERSALVYTSPNDQAELFFHDFDTDGDLDMLSASRFSEGVYLYEHMPDLPRAFISHSFSVGNNCDVDTVYFDNTSLAFFPHSTFEWDFGDGATSSEYHPSHVYAEPGAYDVQLTVCNDLGCDTEMHSVDVFVEEYVVPSFNIPTTGFVGQAIQFVDESENVDNWSWLFGDNSVSTEQSPTHSYEEPGTYEVTLIMTNSTVFDCTFTFTETIVIGEDTGLSNENTPFTYYPNPFSKFLFLDNLPSGEWVYRTYDIAGRQLFAGRVQEKKVDLRKIQAPGTYLLEVVERKGSIYRMQIVK